MNKQEEANEVDMDDGMVVEESSENVDVNDIYFDIAQHFFQLYKLFSKLSNI